MKGFLYNTAKSNARGCLVNHAEGTMCHIMTDQMNIWNQTGEDKGFS